MARRLARLSFTLATSLVLLVVAALPAFASSATKPDPDLDPYLVGSLQQLGTAAIVGIVLGIIAFIVMDKDTSPAEHH